jgi:hypothetical protein
MPVRLRPGFPAPGKVIPVHAETPTGPAPTRRWTMTQGPDDPRRDEDSEPTSAAGAASPQADQADDKEQSEGDPDKP